MAVLLQQLSLCVFRLGNSENETTPAVSTENALGLFIPVLSSSFTFSSTDRSPVLIVNLNQLNIDPQEV